MSLQKKKRTKCRTNVAGHLIPKCRTPKLRHNQNARHYSYPSIDILHLSIHTSIHPSMYYLYPSIYYIYLPIHILHLSIHLLHLSIPPSTDILQLSIHPSNHLIDILHLSIHILYLSIDILHLSICLSIHLSIVYCFQMFNFNTA